MSADLAALERRFELQVTVLGMIAHIELPILFRSKNTYETYNCSESLDFDCSA